MIDPSIKSPEYMEMAEKWILPKALMGGTQAMLSHGSRFLPKHPAENERVYAERSRRTVLRNYFRKSVDRITGHVFAGAVSPDTAFNIKFLEFLTDINLMGQGVTSFARDWFVDALVCGISYAYVDFAAGRPYAVHLKADQLLSIEWSDAQGAPDIQEIRILEATRNSSQVHGRSRERIRRVAKDVWELYEQDDKGKWQIIESAENQLGAVPIVPLYAKRTGFMQAEPPLEDLAYLNLEHFQIRSDQRNALNVASFPILAASGYDPELDGPIEVGPNKVLTTSDTDGRYYYVESTGSALEAGARELKELEQVIQQFGMQLEKGSALETATGRLLEAGDSYSPIRMFNFEVEESLNNLMRWFGKWIGHDPEGRLKLPFEIATNSSEN
ncbi:DUF4055 domain-containing protein [Sneathiella sp. P13V-1]|uniref:DUF4055 domain-containing protein n=1 Tax=Sneathiella sp. P13V-1 TaxID=2697366 RepID=UPI00187B7306|nr:DUF4055 domain-containing protein [Sneathiella sp. P13V-1]MBE7637055.1 DUF4055 domain-containing protein [Sneathiella sp. P13V-1]